MVLELLKRFVVCGSGNIHSESNNIDPRNNQANPVKIYKEIDPKKHYEFKETLGFPGSFGEVKACIEKSSGKEYAVKIQPITKYVKSELELLRVVDNEFVVKAIAIYEFKQKVYIVTEKYNGGDLFDEVMANNGKISDDRLAARYVKQLLTGLKYLHSQKIAHCDIKLANVMLTNDSEKEVRIIDLGVSQIVGSGSLHREVGSLCFIAPEVLMGSYTEMCDMWSVGVLVCTLLFGFNPFNPRCLPAAENRGQISRRILRGFTPECKCGRGAFFPSQISASDEAKDFIAHLLVLDWKLRMSASEALEHPWITQIRD